MGITELAVLRWLHIIAMVYWLGGEWGVFNTSTHVINRDLSMGRPLTTSIFWRASASSPCYPSACTWAICGACNPMVETS